MYDILLKNALIVDPETKTSKIGSLAISDGKIANIFDGDCGEKAKKAIDLTGKILTAGLIDMHCHVYPYIPVPEDGLYNINADAHMLQHGVTTVVDAGSCGWRDFLRFKEQVIDKAEVRILSFLNIASGGMVNITSENSPKDFHPKVVAEIVKAFPETLVGVKTAHYWTQKPFDHEHPMWASVDAAEEAAVLADKPLMVDFYPNGARTYEDMLTHLRPGDIHTHMFAQQFPILDENRKIRDFIWEQRERGIRFDLGHGAGSFWFRNAVPAISQGHIPDTISTDLYMENIHGAAHSLLHIMSKMLNIGLSLEDVISRVTAAPAKELGHSELGTLRIGAEADIAVLELHEGQFGFADCGNAKINGTKKLSCAMTVKGGKIVFDPMAMSMPEWETAPEAYWVGAGII